MAEKKDRSQGGPVNKGNAYVVGEKHQETFIPTQDGQVVPQDDAPQGKDIDQRMTDLLADHKKMGAR